MSLSIPNTCRTETFMSGRPATSSIAAAIDPPQRASIKTVRRDAGIPMECQNQQSRVLIRVPSTNRAGGCGSDVGGKLAETCSAAKAPWRAPPGDGNARLLASCRERAARSHRLATAWSPDFPNHRRDDTGIVCLTVESEAYAAQ